MPNNRAERFTNFALNKVDAFIAEHDDYTRQGVAQLGQGSTNRVVFARRDEDLVVFKVFCEDERKARECFALRHWAATGLVPELIWADDPRMLIMSYIPGVYFVESRRLEGEDAWRQACRATGRAVASLTGVPLRREDRADFESRFYSPLGTLEAYLQKILHLGHSINTKDPDFAGPFWKDNLDFAQAHLPAILAQPRVLYHQDVANLHAQRGGFMGFFDLEMCRVGCAAMQLGSSLGMLVDEPDAWPLFREGWQAQTGTDLSQDDRRAIAAAHHLLAWREISRYLSYDGTPNTGFHWADPADPVRYRKFAEQVARMLEI